MRYLTEAEIQYILSFIDKVFPNYHKDVTLNITSLHKNKLKAQLKTQKIANDKAIELIKKEMERQYVNCLISPGESVGIICGQSIGEKQTQNTLDLFHTAGKSEKAVSSSVDRFNDIISLKKQNDQENLSCTAYFNKEITLLEHAKELVGNFIEGKNVGDFVESFSLHAEYECKPWYDIYMLIYGENSFVLSTHIEYKINTSKLFMYKLTMRDLCIALEKEFIDVYCICSSESEGILDLYLRDTEWKDVEEYMDRQDPIIKNVYVCGIPEIEKVHYCKKENQWYLDMEGTNLVKLATLPFIDNTTIISNSVHEIYELLGIEATRQYLIDTFNSLMPGINPCHPKLLADKMTSQGTIVAITRYTMKNDANGPLSKIAFEESLKNVVTAAACAQKENMEGVSASIICGEKIKAGTGMFDLKLDLSKMI